MVCHRPDGGATSIVAPEAPVLVHAFLPPGGQIAVAWTETYRVAFLDSAEDTLCTFARERPPVPYTDALWDQANRPYRATLENFPGTRCEPASLERPVPCLAALRHILFDETGRMWVEAASEDGFVWEVFDPDGRLIGAAAIPPRSAAIPPYVRDGRLYQVEADELDVPFVAVYRIGPAHR